MLRENILKCYRCGQPGQELIVTLAKRYISVYEKITNQKFTAFDYPIEKWIQQNLQKAGILL